MTKNLKWFAFISIVWVGIYSMVLLRIIHSVHSPTSLMTSWFMVFSFVLASIEKGLLSRDDQRQVRYNLSLRYTLIAAIASCAVTAIWILSWRNDIGLLIGSFIIS